MIPDVEGRSYILEEIIPTGYEDAGPWYVETDGKGKVSVYPATEKDDGTYEKNGEELCMSWFPSKMFRSSTDCRRPAVWAITGIIQERVLC